MAGDAGRVGQAAPLTAASAEVRRRKLDELWRRRHEQAQKLRAVVAAAAPARPARNGSRRTRLPQAAGREGGTALAGERQAEAARLAVREGGAGKGRAAAPDEEAELERRLRELEEELQSLLDLAAGAGGEGSR